MEVRPSYKQSEVGVVPEDWDIKPLLNFADVKTGPFGSALHERDYVSDGTPIITVEHLGDQGVVHENLPLVSDQDRNRLSSYSLRSGDIVFSRVGSVDRNALIRDSEDGWLFSGRLLRIRVLRNDVYPPYLSYHFHSEPFKKRVRNVAVGQTMASLNTQILKGVCAVLPPEPEQRAIAAALSDVDALLGGLERLIAKKRDLKQAAMQHLLTGEKRLPGFSESWKLKRLGDLLTDIGDGATPSTTNTANFGGKIPWVVIEDIRDEIWSTRNTLTEKGLLSCAATLWPAGTLILSTGATIGEVGIARVSLATKQGICGLLFDQDIASTTYMKYWFAQNKKLMLSKAQGSSIKEVRAPTLVKFSVRLPEINEQIAIASVLTDMDAELAALEVRREKTRALKTGMMQELLTGKTRLI